MLDSDSDAASIDKRKHPRVDVRIPATYRSPTLTLDTFVTDISQAGVFLTCPAVDPTGTEAELALALPGRVVRLRGCVVWTRRIPPSRSDLLGARTAVAGPAPMRGARRGMGIRFLAPPRDALLALANFVIARFYAR
jgi:hypothetical protein